jgi:hypothetical protein
MMSVQPNSSSQTGVSDSAHPLSGGNPRQGVGPPPALDVGAGRTSPVPSDGQCPPNADYDTGAGGRTLTPHIHCHHDSGTGDLVSGASPANDPRSLLMENPRNPSVQQKGRSMSTRWNKEDIETMKTEGRQFENASGWLDRRSLYARWIQLQSVGLVSNTPRTLRALGEKYKELRAVTPAPVPIPATQQPPQGPAEIAVNEVSDSIEVPQAQASAHTSPTFSPPAVTTRGFSEPESRVLEVEETSRGSTPSGHEPPTIDYILPGRNPDPPDPPANEEAHPGEGIGLPNPPVNGEHPSGMTDVTVPMEYTDFFERVKRKYDSIYKLPSRPSLRPVRNRRIPEELLKLGNEAVLRMAAPQREGEGVSLARLNRVVYAVAAVTVEYVFERTSSRAQHDWLKENKAFRLLLGQYLGQLKSVIDRLKAELPLTSKQNKNLKCLKRVYGAKYHELHTLRDMHTLYYDLVEHLKKSQKMASVKLTELSRRRVRWAPLSTLFRSKEGSSSAPVQSVRDYWAGIIGKPQPFSMHPALTKWEAECSEILHDEVYRCRAQAEFSDLTLWQKVCQKARPFKATGPDGIHNFWWKVLPAANNLLFRFCLALKDSGSDSFPAWLARGRAIPLYKGSGDRGEPSNYRTIACLNTCYKLLTGLITQWIRSDMDLYAYRFLPYNQMALRQGIWGCTHAHVLDRTIIKDALVSEKPLSIAWIDFAKAFDSVSHEYIRWVLKAIGVNDKLRAIIENLMSHWRLTFEGFEDGRRSRSSPLQVLNGVLQGDTLSPLLFCLCIAALSYHLNNTLDAFVSSHGSIDGEPTNDSLVLSHIYYMDDLVIYSRDPSALQQAILDVEVLSRCMGLTLNCRKSALYHIRSNVAPSQELARIPTLRKYETYKYLGLEKSETVAHAEMWKQCREKILSKTREIWESELTFRQKVAAFNAIAIPKVKYIISNEIYGVGKFKTVLAEGTRLDRSVRTLLVKLKARHRSCSVARLYLDSEKGGWGLKSFREAIRDAIVYTFCYVSLKPDLQPCRYMMECLGRRNKRTLFSDFRKVLVDLKDVSIQVESTADYFRLSVDGRLFEDPTKAARAITSKLHAAYQVKLLRNFKGRKAASRIMTDENLDLSRSFLWLQKGLLNSTAVNNAIAAQEGQLLLKAHPMYAGVADQACRLGCLSNEPARRKRETPEHILSICPHWRPSLMVTRHNSVAATLYNAICRKLGCETRHYNQRIEGIRKWDQYELYWDHPITTTRTLRHYRPDIVLFDNSLKRATIIEVSVSWYTHLEAQERRKYAKYAINSELPENQPLNAEGTFPNGNNLASELGRDRGHVVAVIPIVVGALGEISKNTHGNLLKLNFTPAECENLIERLARSAVIGSACIIKAHCSVQPHFGNTS